VIAGAVAIVILTMATVIDVTLRSFFASGLTGATEIVTCLLTVVVYMGAGYCTLKRGLIVVELFKVPKGIIVANDIACVAIGAVIIYCTTTQAFFSMGTGVGSLLLNIPKWPFMLVTAFGYLVMSLALILNIIEDAQSGRPQSDEKHNQADQAGETGA